LSTERDLNEKPLAAGNGGEQSILSGQFSNSGMSETVGSVISKTTHYMFGNEVTVGFYLVIQ
jgi:hypothetical protein